MSRPWLKVVVIPVAVLVVYFIVPVDAARAPLGVLVGILVSATALGLVAVMVFSEVRRAQRRLSAWHLVLALEIVLIVFSFTYYLVASNAPNEFVGLRTRLDAIYFSTTTVATVGFGDVHASGQLARALITVHMVFNLVFIGALVNLARDRVSERRDAVRDAAAETPPDEDE